jgi:hypothetical protein
MIGSRYGIFSNDNVELRGCAWETLLHSELCEAGRRNVLEERRPTTERVERDLQVCVSNPLVAASNLVLA